MIRRPPSSPLFPSPPLFRSEGFRPRLAARDQELFVFRRCRSRSRRYGHVLAPLDGLVLRVLARDPRGDLHPATVQVGLELLLVLAAEPEAVRAHRGLLVADLIREPDLIGGLVLAPHLPLARVVFEDRLVDHRDAVLDGADGLAHATG